MDERTYRTLGRAIGAFKRMGREPLLVRVPEGPFLLKQCERGIATVPRNRFPTGYVPIAKRKR